MPEGPRERTPQPSVADVVDPLRPHRLEQATDDLMGRPDPGLPALGLGVRVAEADLVILGREQAVVGQRPPVDISAQVIQDRLWAWHGRLAVDAPPRGPHRRGNQQVGPFLWHQHPKQTTNERREGMDGDQGGRAGRPPLRPLGGDPTGRDEAVHVRMVGQGTGPGGPHTHHPAQTADIVGGRGQLDERPGRGTKQDVVEVLWLTAANLPERGGHGEDDGTGGDRQEVLTSLCQPGFGVLLVPGGATAVAAGVIGIVLWTTGVTRPQGPTSGRGATGDERSPGAAVAGQKVLAESCPRVRAIAPADVRPLGHARAPRDAWRRSAGARGGAMSATWRGVPSRRRHPQAEILRRHIPAVGLTTEANSERTACGLTTTGSVWRGRGRMSVRTGPGRCRGISSTNRIP
jgi:hypothetical protein